jgi:hypothetical protein
MIGAVGLVYWCVLMLSEQESDMSAWICKSCSDVWIVYFAVLGTGWVSQGVYKFSKSGKHLSISCVGRVPWNVSYTEDSQILVPLCKMKLPGQCCTQDVGSSVVVTHWSLQRCTKGNEASLSVQTVVWLWSCCFTGVMQLLVAGMNLYSGSTWTGGMTDHHLLVMLQC